MSRKCDHSKKLRKEHAEVIATRDERGNWYLDTGLRRSELPDHVRNGKESRHFTRLTVCADKTCGRILSARV